MIDKRINAVMQCLARRGRLFRDGVFAVMLLATTGCVVCGTPPKIAPRDYVFHQTDWNPLCQPCQPTGEASPPLQTSKSRPSSHEVVPRPTPEPTPPPATTEKSAAFPVPPKPSNTEPLGLFAVEEMPHHDPTTTPPPQPTDEPAGLLQPVDEDIAFQPERTPGPLAQPLPSAGILTVAN